MYLEELEEMFIRIKNEEINSWCMRNGLLRSDMRCDACTKSMYLEKYKNYIDKFTQRYKNISCEKKYIRINIRKESYLASFTIPLKTILKILLRLAGRQTRFSILSTINIGKDTFQKLIDILIRRMSEENMCINKIGGVGNVVQVDETMLNFKCKSHRGRSPENKTDALCLIETGVDIPKIIVKIISDKKMSTIIPIIEQYVISGTTIYTDEHKSYMSLSKIDYPHFTVCHKYNFINPENQTHTQNVESLNNSIKLEIKTRKGIMTKKREAFCEEFMWKWNNKLDLWSGLIRLLKI